MKSEGAEGHAEVVEVKEEAREKEAKGEDTMMTERTTKSLASNLNTKSLNPEKTDKTSWPTTKTVLVIHNQRLGNSKEKKLDS